MSKAQLDRFISFVSNDPAVLQQASHGAEESQQWLRNVVQYAKAQGYDFTEDEAKAWLDENSQQPSGGELKDSQLDAVAGGIIVIGNRTERAAPVVSAYKAVLVNPPDDGKTR